MPPRLHPAPRIVPITLAHAASFHAALDAVAREERWLAQRHAPPPERIEAFVREGVEKDAVQFVALDEQARVVGWADVMADWAHAVAHRGSLGMGVLAAWRGQGVGRALLAACIAKAWHRRLTRIELEVRVDNVAAIALYRRLGFVEEGRKREGMRFDERAFDTLVMGLLQRDSLHGAGAR